ncbi:MAG: Na+/H+ antiporter NhaA [Pseudonocardiaceae bacterium]
MTEAEEPATPFAGLTAWRNLRTPLRAFLRTETGSAVVLLAATIAALVWVNVDSSSYRTVWEMPFSIRLGGSGLTQDLRGWVNSGLMAFFFFVVGLEARREYDMGELRDRRRLVLPLVAGLGGMAVPVAIYLAANAGLPSARGWGASMSTDTAFALGMLALVGSRFAGRLCSYLLTVLVVDDLVALGVITVAYSEQVATPALLFAIGIFVVTLLVLAARVRYGLVYAVLGVAMWVALFSSGVDPVVAGLAMGLLTYAHPAVRGDLERATDLFRLFREQPTPELARSARVGLGSALSPNDRLQELYHPWTSYLIVPLFALGNAGIELSWDFLSRAFTSPITLGILVGYVAGKPVGIVGASWLVTWCSRGRLRPPVGWAAVLGGGAIAGIGFTLSLLIATLAFGGQQLEEAKVGVLSAALAASVLSWLVFRGTALLPTHLRHRALLGTADVIIDLAAPVDPTRDHLRGPQDAPVTMVEYGDLECPYCGQAEPVVRELLSDFGDLRYVWRHLPLDDVHPHARLAAEATEAAAEQEAFWDMHDALLAHQGALRASDLVRYARDVGLDVERFRQDLGDGVGAARIAEDVDSADVSGVSGTPTFFINGRRHHGAYDIDALSAAVRAARARAGMTS